MVNFNDPIVMEEDARVYTFLAILYYLGSIMSPLDSGGLQAVARCVWTLHVGLTVPLDFSA